MVVKKVFKSFCFLYSRHNPERMVEILLIGGTRERIVAVFRIIAKHIEELIDFCFMNKTSLCSCRHFCLICLWVACPSAEELRELERCTFLYKLVKEFVKAIGVDFHLWQLCVWIILQRMLFRKLLLGLLLLNVIPRIDFVIFEIIEKIERGT